MGKLFETFLKIESGRKKCINSLNAMNVPTSEDANFDTIAEKIKARTGEINIEKEQYMWERPSEWIDTDALLYNAPELDGYTPYGVYLLHNNRPTISIILTSLASNNAVMDDAYYLSDGTFLTHDATTQTTVEHTWDTTKDIEIGLNYKLRYAIVYGKNSKIDYINNQSTSYKCTICNEKQYGIGISSLEFVCDLSFLTNDRQVIMSLPRRNTTNTIDFYRIHILGDIVPSTSGTYPSTIKEIKIDKHGYFKFNIFFANGTVELQTKWLIPNATEIGIHSSGSGYGVYGTYFYIPNVTKIVNTSSYSTSITCQYIYAPKLIDSASSLSMYGPSIDYLLSYDFGAGGSVGVDQYPYLNKLVHKITKTEAELPNNISGYKLYNDIIRSITNTAVYNWFSRSIVLPSLQSVTFANIFTNSSYAADTTEFIIGDGFKSNLNVSKMTYLPTLNVLDIVKKLADVTNEEQTYTLTLGTTLLALLSDEEKAIATNKGWVLE